MTVQPRRYEFGGVIIDALTRETAVARIIELARAPRASYVCVTGGHGILVSRKDPKFRKALLEAALVTPDGAPLAWFGRIICDPHMRKVTGWPIVYGVFDDPASRTDLRHYFFGSIKEVTDAMTEKLKARSPGCTITGAFNPPFRPISDDELKVVADEIKSLNANTIWIGLSTPLQEMLAQRLVQYLDHGVLITCGAAFDFAAGRKPIVPEVISALGCEWLFRLLSEPRRLWKRYFVIVPNILALFVSELVRHWLGLRHSPSSTQP